MIAVEQDQKLKFASVPYNDPYTQWPRNAEVAATYQWGHYAMNFINASGQGAHDVHQGHGFVATLDGLAGQSAGIPADLLPNVRQHLAFGAARQIPLQSFTVRLLIPLSLQRLTMAVVSKVRVVVAHCFYTRAAA